MVGVRPMRTVARVQPDLRRVVGRPYIPGDDPVPGGQTRLEAIAERVLALTDAEVTEALEDVRARFTSRHRHLERMIERNMAPIVELLGAADKDRCLLGGAYLTHEFTFEGAALTNPSMVVAPDQSHVPDGAVRFILSLRAIGEGHLSSIEFRTGLAGPDGSVSLDEISLRAETGERSNAVYERSFFSSKLGELGADERLAAVVLDQLPRHFDSRQLEHALGALDDRPRAIAHETVRLMRRLAASNYLLVFDPDTKISERLMWPESPVESRGMEDARFVRFTESGGVTTYYGTYTAFDGFGILPQLIETNDFRSFEISTLNGRHAQNKGIALFPRLINGRYVALSRPDRENIHVLQSDNPRFWSEPSTLVRRPRRSWELIQMGNCGSPIETTQGWLVLTHGVGPMRTYRLGVLLLDLDDPDKVLADLDQPLLEPEEADRDGYVPNVVYSCGAMVHGDHLLVPYGVADRSANVAAFSVEALLDELLADQRVRRSGRS